MHKGSKFYGPTKWNFSCRQIQAAFCEKQQKTNGKRREALPSLFNRLTTHQADELLPVSTCLKTHILKHEAHGLSTCLCNVNKACACALNRSQCSLMHKFKHALYRLCCFVLVGRATAIWLKVRGQLASYIHEFQQNFFFFSLLSGTFNHMQACRAWNPSCCLLVVFQSHLEDQPPP